jgi:hypothetical protein
MDRNALLPPPAIRTGPAADSGKIDRLKGDLAAADSAIRSALKAFRYQEPVVDARLVTSEAAAAAPRPDELRSRSLRAWEASVARDKSSLPRNVARALEIPLQKRTSRQANVVRDYFVEHVYAGSRSIFDPLHAQRAAALRRLDEAEQNSPSTLVMQDTPKMRDIFVLVRGAYDRKGEKVLPGVPAAIGPALPADAPLNRLSLARWIVDSRNPLTARVIVNRFWQHYFGTGIVKTAEDFGAQGEWPTHPELLDWLATELEQSGWNVKRIQRLIVTSAAYRLSSHVSPALAQRDPENRLLARGPRFRMDAEMVRDTALAVSGLLVTNLGGKSVKPYQPSGLWEAIGYSGSNTVHFVQDKGDALYRRSLYTFWKRTSPPPSLTTFDAPSREECVVRRGRTNTPLQALALMNDEQYVEAARHLAERMMRDGGKTVSDRIALGFRLATSRQPTQDEIRVFQTLYTAQSAVYARNRQAAAKLLDVGESRHDRKWDPCELAAWTMVANVMLNLDETVTKG